MSLKDPRHVHITQRVPQAVKWNGKWYTSVACGIVDGERAALLVGGTSFWVAEAEVTR